MSVPKLQLQSEASDLFRYCDEDWKVWSDYTFTKVSHAEKGTIVDGIELVNKLQEIKEILDEIKEELDSDSVQYMETDEGELCKIFDMGENLIEDKWWLYDYEIDMYYEMIENKVMEYNVLVKEIEDEKNKIQMEKDVCLGISLALLRI